MPLDDDGPPTGVALSVSPSSVGEDAGATIVTVTATAQGGSTFDKATAVRVTVGASGDSASSGDDYAAIQDFDITLPAGTVSGTATFTLTPVDDIVDEGAGETFTLAGSLKDFTVTETSITIVDNDDPPSGIALSLIPDSVLEAGWLQQVGVEATVTGGTAYSSATEVSVSVGAASDSAIPDIDYESVGDFTITIPAGASRARGRFNLLAVTNAADEDDKAISIAGTANNLNVAGAVLTLRDDDISPILSIKGNVVDEGASGEAVQLRFTVQLNEASRRQVTVDYIDSGEGTATSGADYAAIARGTLVFTPGETEQTVDVSVLGDTVSEGNETVVLRLLSPFNATFHFRDDIAHIDGKGTISDGPALAISRTSPSSGANAAEGETVEFTITADEPAENDMQVNLWVTDGGDYLNPADENSRQVTLRAGQTSVTFSLVIATDNLDEPLRTVSVELLSGDGYRLLDGKRSASVFVDDDMTAVEPPPVPTIGVSGGVAVDEGGTARLTLTADAAPKEDLILNLAISQQGVFVSADSLGDQRFSFPAGQTQQNYNLDTTADENDESDGSITLTLISGDGYQVEPDARFASVPIRDDDATTITMSRPASGAIAENGGTTDIRVALGRRLEKGESVTVPLDIGGATQGTHYDLALVGSDSGITLDTSDPHSRQNPALRFNGPSERQATLHITAKPNRQAGILNLSIGFGTGSRTPASSGLSGGLTTAGSVGIPIADDDAEVSIVSVRGTEGNELEFVVSLPRAAPSGGVTVNYETIDGSGASGDQSYQIATSGSDYSGVSSGSITITGGQRHGSIRIATRDDDVYEGDHYFRVRLTQISHFDLGSTDTALGIVDDTADRPTFTFAAASVEVEEGAGVAALAVQRNGATLVPTTVDYATVSGSASAGSDYVSVSGELAFSSSDNALTFNVPIVDDSMDEASEDFRVTIATDEHGTPGVNGEAQVRIIDNDSTEVSLSFGPGSASEIQEGSGSNEIVLSLGRQLKTGEVLSVPLSFNGAAELGVDYTLTAPATWPTGVIYSSHFLPTPERSQSELQPSSSPSVGLKAAQSSTDPLIKTIAGAGQNQNLPTITFVGGAQNSSDASFVVTPMTDTKVSESIEMVVIGIADVGTDMESVGNSTIMFEIVNVNQYLPVIFVSAQKSQVTEGDDIVLTVTGEFHEDAPADTTVKAYVALATNIAAWPQGSDLHPDKVVYSTPELTVAQPTADIRIITADDDQFSRQDNVLVAVLTSSSNYRRPQDSDRGRAKVRILDNDAPDEAPVLQLADARVKEAPGAELQFAVTLDRPADASVTVDYQTAPVTATEGTDYAAAQGTLTFTPGETDKTVAVTVFDDVHDEGEETLELRFSNLHGAQFDGGDKVATGVIANSDPMPAAWLARFGRTVAEQVLDGVADRIGSDRAPGLEIALAGHSVPMNSSSRTESGRAVDTNLTFSELDGRFAAGSRYGSSGETSTQTQSMTTREALLSSHFSITKKVDEAGGSLAVWSRAAQGNFEGREGGFSLDGEVTTAMLGTDYAKDDWLLGLAFARSEGKGEYHDTGITLQPDTCPEPTGSPCREAIRAGDGKVEASLAAVIPYGALQVSERLSIWGAAGYGTGEVSLMTGAGEYKADADWSMAAAGLRGDLLDPSASESGLALAAVSDVLWTRSASADTSQLAASISNTSRIRFGVEGSWHTSFDDGSNLAPKLELGVRHDGGDAETGYGIDLGAGIAWSNPGRGLSLDVSGRTLLEHKDDDLKDRGVSAALIFDPRPTTERGPSFSMRQEVGGQATGGIDSLFTPATLDDRSSSETESRLVIESAYGVPVFGGQFTGSPHVGLGLGSGTRDYTLGWRVTQGNPSPGISFSVTAHRTESDVASPETSFGFQFQMTW